MIEMVTHWHAKAIELAILFRLCLNIMWHFKHYYNLPSSIQIFHYQSVAYIVFCKKICDLTLPQKSFSAYIHSAIQNICKNFHLRLIGRGLPSQLHAVCHAVDRSSRSWPSCSTLADKECALPPDSDVEVGTLPA